MIKHLKQNERDLRKEIMIEAERSGIIRSATLELLDFCNFKCKFCYVKESYKNIIPKERAFQVIKELRDEGCVWLLLTGGEPLLHPDFSEIYLFAYELGFKVSIFTNGALVSKEICEMLQEYPPEVVEISLYGHSAETYDKFVGVDGAFGRFDENIDMLRQYDIKLILKFTLTTINVSHMCDLKNYCETKKIEYRFDDMVIPRLDSQNEECLNLRVCPEIAYECMLSDQNYTESLRKASAIINDNDIDNHIYTCGAGKNAVVIDAAMKLHPCILERRISYNLAPQTASIKDGQQYLLSRLEGYLSDKDKCFGCIYKPYCRYCPARFALETGDERIPPSWYCKYGNIAYNTLKEIQSEIGDE